MKSNDDRRWTTRLKKWKRKARLFRVRQHRIRKKPKPKLEAEQRVSNADAHLYGITCNNAYALPKTTADLCRQEMMEKRLRASRFCCQARRVQVGPPDPAASASASAPTNCPNCPAAQQPLSAARQTRAGGGRTPPPLSNGALTRPLPCQALPPPPPCAPQCPPCPPCPPSLSTPLKASDYIHTTTECYPNNAKEDPCRWDNTTCYNEGNDSSGNTIRQWNTRCQFASNSTGPNGCVNGGAAGRPGPPVGNNRAGGSAVGGGSMLGSAAGLANVNGAGSGNVAVADAIASDLNHRAANNGRAANESVCPHDRCRSAASVPDHCFRKCKKELMIHFPSGKCGTQLQLRRSAKLGNLITPRPSTMAAAAAATTTTTTTARPDIVPTAAVTGFASRSKMQTTGANAAAANKDLLAESPMSTTRAPPLLTTPLTPITPVTTSAADTVRYRPQMSLIDDDMPPLTIPHQQQVDTSILTNRASQLRWLQNKRKLCLANNKRSIIESEMTPPLTQPNITADFYKNDFDWGRLKR